jgi:PAS domain S-box-containing protein
LESVIKLKTTEKRDIVQFDRRKSGIPLIDDLPWGSHFCQFYQTVKDQLDILVPYFRTGLEENEFCLWVISEPLGLEDAKKALEEAVPHFADYSNKGQMEIIPDRIWLARGGKSGKAILSRVDKAVSAGLNGLRLACNVFPEEKSGKGFSCYGADAVSRYNAIALFAYPRDKFDAVGLMEVVKSHRFALVRNAGRWEVIESSEARTVKDALKRSEEKLQSLFSNMSEGFAYHRVVLNAGGRPCDYLFLEVNDAFERLTGLKGKNIIGKKVTEALPGIEKDPIDWIGKYGKVALTGKPLHFESYSEQLKKWYSISAFSPHKGYFAVTFSDITERKKSEEALKRSNLKLEILAESARLLLTSEAPEKIVQTICEKVMNHLDCHAFFNYLVEEGQERMRLNACAGIPEESAKEIEWLDFGAAVCGCVARDGCRIIAEDISNTPDERTALVRSFGILAYACHPLIYRGRTIGTLSFGTCNRPRFSHEEIELMKAVTDLVVTAMSRKKAEERITTLNEKLKRNVDELSSANRELEAFSYSVSHDLRSPLRSIDGFSQEILEDYGDRLDENGLDSLRRMRAASQRMGLLIDGLLNLSRLTRSEIVRGKVHLSALAHDIASDLRKAHSEREVDIVIAEGLVDVGDERLLYVLLQNLLGNAWKFTEKRKDALIEFGVSRIDGKSAYFVRDNGAGFDMTYADKLFRPFQRLHDPTSFPGTGIGLATVQRIIHRHGGRVRAEGEIGKGAAFYFTLK